MNRPLPPIAARGRSSISSPCVVTPSRETSHAGYNALSRARTCSACHSASADSRVAMTSRRGTETGAEAMDIERCKWGRAMPAMPAIPNGRAAGIDGARRTTLRRILACVVAPVLAVAAPVFARQQARRADASGAPIANAVVGLTTIDFYGAHLDDALVGLETAQSRAQCRFVTDARQVRRRNQPVSASRGRRAGSTSCSNRSERNATSVPPAGSTSRGRAPSTWIRSAPPSLARQARLR